MIERVKAVFHRHQFSYQASNGSASTEADYNLGARFVTKSCKCGATGHNIGYVPAPASFELEPTTDY